LAAVGGATTIIMIAQTINANSMRLISSAAV
jgi:hypothetical protein